MLRTSEPIFAATDVPATVRFYCDVLGFSGQWLWGDPPTFGGVRWGSVQILFGCQPELAKKIEGHGHFFRGEDIQGLYELHKGNNAPIISDIENKPWGIREYTIRDINGYHLRFGGPEKYERPATASRTMPEFIRIVERLPTLDEFVTLTDALNWNRNDPVNELALRNSLFGVVALDTRAPVDKQIAGAIRVVGDGARFFYIQDVMVVPQLQSQRIGSAMMESTMDWLKRTAPKGAYIGLFTGKAAFYERFGFHDTAGGMTLIL